MHAPSPDFSHPGSPSPDNLINPLAPKQSEQEPPDDRFVIGALLGEGAAKDFTALLPHKEQEIPPKADLPEEEFALSPKEAEKARAQEQETPEQQARAWFLGLGKDEDWIKEHFIFEGEITCIAETLDLSNCNIAELPSFFKKIKKITHLNLNNNNLATPQNTPKEIGGHLYLSGNPKLTSLTGLEGVRVGGYFFLSFNQGLTSLKGLEGVCIGGDLKISYNLSLASCVGLEEATIKGSLWLNKNPRLASLEGLPLKENIGGSLVFSEDQPHLIKEAREKGYKIHIIT